MPTPTMVLFKTVPNGSWNEPFLLTTKEKFTRFLLQGVDGHMWWLTERSCFLTYSRFKDSAFTAVKRDAKV